MRFNRLGAFTLGVIITAASVGAVSFANAAGDGTLKACANKTSGAMRYISKGSCKKTETSLSWNQMGPQGLPGVAGAKGDTGVSGSNGTAGTNGTNGQNFYAVDATGKTLGPIIGNYGVSVDVLIDNFIWSLQRSNNQISSSLNNGGAYDFSDASCTVPYLRAQIGEATTSQGIVIDYGSNYNFETSDKAYKVTGSQVSWTGKTIYRWKYLSSSSTVCTAYTDSEKSALALTDALYTLIEVTKPTYTAPLTIVAR